MQDMSRQCGDTRLIMMPCVCSCCTSTATKLRVGHLQYVYTSTISVKMTGAIKYIGVVC